MIDSPDSADAIETLVGRCLVHVLDKDGHALYLRHPHGGESVLVAFHADRNRSDESLRRLRRIVLGLVYEALLEGKP